jgi:transcriptional regulator with XRE-family HTH domain
MGRGTRFQPKKLAGKLREIRERLGLNQNQIFKKLGNTQSNIYASHISGYELGTREPPLDVLLRYSRVAGIPVELLIDDKLNLPSRIPSEDTYEWVLKVNENTR